VSKRKFALPAALLGAALSGCASLPADSGRGDVAGLLKQRGHEVPAQDDRDAGTHLLAELAGKPLSARDAIHLALVNNPGLKAEYARLGFAAADVYDAGRLSNPSLSASVMFPNVSGEANQVGFGLAQSFTDLLLLPARSRFAEGEFERAKLLVGTAALNLAADTELAYTRLAAAWQVLTMREAIAKAAQASADLAQRFFDAGNINRLELSLEQAAASQAQLDVLGARAEVTLARNALNRLMGLAAKEDAWKIADQLAAPVPEEDDTDALFALAERSRLDLAAARKNVTLLADALGVTRRFRYLGAIDLGVETERETDRSRLTGPTLSLELPLFNQGKGKVARSQAQLALAEAELRELEIAISNGVRRAAAEVAVAKQRAEHYRSSLIPLREAIVARTQEEVNFMLVGQFELLLVKQQEYDAYQGYLEAVRDYWLARVELAREVGAPLPSAAQAGNDMLDAEKLIQPKDSGMGGMDHGGMQMDGMDEMKGMDHSGHNMKGMDMPMGDMPGMNHSGHDTKVKGGTVTPPKRESGSHEGHDMGRTGMEGMGTHEDGKDMPAHGAPKKPKPNPADDATSEPSHQHHH
jgi:outer membrane protein, heavy metal efflux system